MRALLPEGAVRNPDTGRRGFTIAELLMVVLIMGIMAMLVTPAVVSRLPDYFINDTQDHLVAQMRTARMTAMADSAPVEVSFDTGAGRFTVWADTNNNNAVDSGESRDFALASNRRVAVSVAPVRGVFRATGEFVSGSMGQPSLLIDIQATGTTRRRGVRIWPSGRVEPTQTSVMGSP